MKTNLSVDDVRALMRRQIETTGGQSKWAQAVGVTQGYVSEVLRGGRAPGADILKALGVERTVTVTYKRIKQ